MTSPLKITKANGVMEIVLDRPKANAIDAATSRLMGETFQDFRDDPEMRVAIITGAGEKFFCPGWDLKAASEGEEADSDYGVGGWGGFIELPRLNKPVICAVNGICFGGGFEVMIGADIVIAADHATFALPEINIGIVANIAAVSTFRRMPKQAAMEFMLTGRVMDMDEAKHWGLVSEVMPMADLMPRAREIAELLASGPPLAFAALKDIVRRTENMPEQQALEYARALHATMKCFESEDMLEGATAFAEKRKPKWQGK
ncbi:MAG: enoyl-CoA hydratase-related protein [Pseudomonadota bacterium]